MKLSSITKHYKHNSSSSSLTKTVILRSRRISPKNLTKNRPSNPPPPQKMKIRPDTRKMQMMMIPPI